MKYPICFFVIVFFWFSCQTSSDQKSVSIPETSTDSIVNTLDSNSQMVQVPIESAIDTIAIKDAEIKNEQNTFYFEPGKYVPSQRVRIGKNREYHSLSHYLSEVDYPNDVHIVIDDGSYYSEGLYIRADDIIIEGTGPGVNLYCTEYETNVMDICGRNILIKNIRMKHLKPGKNKDQDCTGRVIMFDNAEHVTIENCDLNGCGLSALHDNVSNSDILIKNCYIHNNSVGAYTSSEGGIWFKEEKNHPVFKFENNRLENNGPDRIKEKDEIIDEAVEVPVNKIPKGDLNDIEYWKTLANPLILKYTGVEFGDYFHLLFEERSGIFFDFGSGANDYGVYELYDDKTFYENPEYLNQTFKLFWEWKLSTFYCCNGEYNIKKELQPSIIKLELIEADSDKNKK